MNEEPTDPIRQSQIDTKALEVFERLERKRLPPNCPVHSQNQERLAQWAYEAFIGDVRSRQDWRKSQAIADCQGKAVALALSVCGDLEITSESDIPQFIERISKIAAKAIIDENMKHVREIQASLAKLREMAMTDEELEALMN